MMNNRKSQAPDCRSLWESWESQSADEGCLPTSAADWQNCAFWNFEIIFLTDGQSCSRSSWNCCQWCQHQQASIAEVALHRAATRNMRKQCWEIQTDRGPCCASVPSAVVACHVWPSRCFVLPQSHIPGLVRKLVGKASQRRQAIVRSMSVFWLCRSSNTTQWVVSKGKVKKRDILLSDDVISLCFDLLPHVHIIIQWQPFVIRQFLALNIPCNYC